ncbi:MAG: nitrate/nitrite transporter NrtS [Deltaproteobacteria bacterium]|nr:nitrate/nitrite transporter NrtS [Deltaproteobacteria bacterium]
MVKLLHYWFRRETVIRALKMAAIVGPILTVINQGDVLLSGQYTPPVFLKIILTFLVPYSVSSVSSALTYMEQEQQEKR